MNWKKLFLTLSFISIGIVILSVSGYFIFAKKHISSSDSYIGILTVTKNCAIPEGCGPRYKLFNSDFKSYIPLLGNLKDNDSELIIKVTGSKTALPQSEYNGMNYNGPKEALRVSSYTVLSKIPYHDFLVSKADEYTQQRYPCLSHTVYGNVGTDYNKTFSWEQSENTIFLKVKMSGVKGSYELRYDGNSGNFIKEVVDPLGTVFCQ